MQPTIHCNKKPDIEAVNVRVAFSIPSGSLFLVNHPVLSNNDNNKSEKFRGKIVIHKLKRTVFSKLFLTLLLMHAYKIQFKFNSFSIFKYKVIYEE
jgi:hypothetical protein